MSLRERWAELAAAVLPSEQRGEAMKEDCQSTQARRAAITGRIQAETGIDEPMIERLVRGFYARVAEDALLGPVFASNIEEWEPHLQRMCAFWSSVALMSGRYHGQPTAKHMPLPIRAQHFDRWLLHFKETAHELCPPEAAEHFIKLAQRIADSLKVGIAAKKGSIAAPRHATSSTRVHDSHKGSSAA